MEEKHAGGRPPKFKTAEEMQKVIDNYFNSCFRVMTDKDGNIIRDDNGHVQMQQYKPFTITGLALALDLDRKSLLNYSNKNEEFFHTIKKAKEKVENFLEERLIMENSVTGIIFNLKNNFDWKDKLENINIETNYEDYIKKVVDENEY